ncbi:MAG: LysR family transcriptional regulator [Proteobacteria bacterium]|nr:LysR family transcriptional regulator [Pseudomonadota bacterium]
MSAEGERGGTAACCFAPESDPRRAHTFVAVVEHKGFRGAAQRLHVSQPPPTRQIQQLEELPGVSYRPLAKSDNLSFDLCMIFGATTNHPCCAHSSTSYAAYRPRSESAE